MLADVLMHGDKVQYVQVAATGEPSGQPDTGNAWIYVSSTGAVTVKLADDSNVPVGASIADAVAITDAGTATGNVDILTMTNTVNAASMTNTRQTVLFNQWYYDATTPAIADIASIVVGTVGNWTSTGTTQDGYVSFTVAVNGTLTERIRINDTGIGFFATAPAAQAALLAAPLTSITHTAPGTPDYALQDLVQNTGFGFATADEGNTLLSVVLALQVGYAAMRTALTNYGLFAAS